MTGITHKFSVVTEEWESHDAAEAAEMFMAAFLGDLTDEQRNELYHALFDTELATRLRLRKDIPPRVYELYESALAYARKFGDLYGKPANDSGNIVYIAPVTS